jgi:hypothetical protein
VILIERDGGGGVGDRERLMVVLGAVIFALKLAKTIF